MGEILCHNCGVMYWHLDFHFNGLTHCKSCKHNLGKYCEYCNQYVCDSCHSIFEHIENIINYFKDSLANSRYELALYEVSLI